MKFFEIEKQSKKSAARAGILKTAHGEARTPLLMTVGTRGIVKNLDAQILPKLKTQVLLANTYHLHIFPGEDLISDFGGLHEFCGWNGPIFTDSGGFQIFSMGHGIVADEIKGKNISRQKKTLLKIDENGAIFKSYRDGSRKILTPESSMEIQFKLNSDLIAAFDECTPFHAGKSYTADSMYRTHRWLGRCRAELKKLNSKQFLYGIIQGGVFEDLRKISCDFVADSACDGICIGGSLGDCKKTMNEVVNFCCANLPTEKPIHLLGIGDFPDILNAVGAGVDTFDCVSTTRNARHGTFFCNDFVNFKAHISNAQFTRDAGPLDENCKCEVCKNYSRAFLHYLFKAGEISAQNLLSAHNIFFVNNFFEKIRTAILNDKFEKFAEKCRENFS